MTPLSIMKLGIAAFTLVLASTAWSADKPAADPNRENRPGGTTQIAPTPGPATSPALASPVLPSTAVENREHAQAKKAQKKAQKKAKRASKRTDRGESLNHGNSNTPAASTTPGSVSTPANSNMPPSTSTPSKPATPGK